MAHSKEKNKSTETFLKKKQKKKQSQIYWTKTKITMLKKFRELKKYVYEEKTKLNATREKWTIVHRNSQEDCWQISY